MRGVAIFFILALSLLAGCSRAPEPAIEDPVNIDVWLERLEGSSRELYSAREAVVDAMTIEEGAIVADIGAGTGLYSLLFADAVGAAGHVFAVDIEPLFLDLINRRVSDNNYNNVTTVLGRQNSVTLPASSVDVFFIADSYHYFDDAGAMLQSIHNALKPDGSLYIVEFNLNPGEAKPDFKAHVKGGRGAVIAEIEATGFIAAPERSVDGLTENYFVRFQKQ